MFKHKDTTAFTREKIEKTVKRVEELIDDTPESLDTLKEVADTISSMQKTINSVSTTSTNTNKALSSYKNNIATHYYIDGKYAFDNIMAANTFNHLRTANSVTMVGRISGLTNNGIRVPNFSWLPMWNVPVVTDSNAGICTADMYNQIAKIDDLNTAVETLNENSAMYPKVWGGENHNIIYKDISELYEGDDEDFFFTTLAFFPLIATGGTSYFTCHLSNNTQYILDFFENTHKAKFIAGLKSVLKGHYMFADVHIDSGQKELVDFQTTLSWHDTDGEMPLTIKCTVDSIVSSAITNRTPMDIYVFLEDNDALTVFGEFQVTPTTLNSVVGDINTILESIVG